MTTLGAEIDDLWAVRESKRRIEEQLTEIKKTIAEKEKLLLERMDREGLSKSTGSCATISVTENVKPSVVDWDAFYKFIARTKYYHLLERRPSVTGCRELFELKGKIPGVVPFSQRQINIRTLND